MQKICRLEAMEVGGDPFEDDGDVRDDVDVQTETGF